MAGVKGKSGGYRPGAGAKPRAPILLDLGQKFDDPKDFLIKAMSSTALDLRLRIDAAKALLPYQYAKAGEGKKQEAEAAASRVAKGKFAPATPPKLVFSKTK